MSRANELEKLTAQEKKLEQELLVAQADMQEAQRQCDQVEFQMKAAQDQSSAGGGSGTAPAGAGEAV
mgnify:CR=1 FL=1